MLRRVGLVLFLFSGNITNNNNYSGWVGIISNIGSVSDNQKILVNGYELPGHLSHSALTTFQQCGHKYYLSRVVNVEETPAWWFIGGNAVHTATENFDRMFPNEVPAGQPDTNFFFDALVEEAAWAEFDSGVDPSEFRAGGRVSKQYPNKEDSVWWLENGPAMFESWVSWRQGSGWQIADFDGQPAIEIGFKFPVGDALVQMYLDRLMVNEHGELVVVDLKSGSSSPKSPLQLAMYAYGAEKMLGVRPKWGTFWKAREGTTTPLIDLDKYPAERIEYIVSGFDKLRKSGIFLPNLDECGWCGFNQVCEWSTVK